MLNNLIRHLKSCSMSIVRLAPSSRPDEVGQMQNSLTPQLRIVLPWRCTEFVYDAQSPGGVSKRKINLVSFKPRDSFTGEIHASKPTRMLVISGAMSGVAGSLTNYGDHAATSGQAEFTPVWQAPEEGVEPVKIVS